MGTIINRIYRIEKKNFALIILLQLLVILTLATLLVMSNSQRTVLSSETNAMSDSITADVKSCLSLSQEERPLCAKMIGVKIAANFESPADRLKECLKFRPYAYSLNCELGLAGE